MDYITYVQEQIKSFKKESELIDSSLDEITPSKINTVLANFSNVQLGLFAEFERRKTEQKALKRSFQAWWDEKFVAKRKQLNPQTLPGSKWASKNEIESEVRVDNVQEFNKWQEQIDEIDGKVSFLYRLIEEWKSLGYRLNTLSENSRQEMASLGIESKIGNTRHRLHSFKEDSKEEISKLNRRKISNYAETNGIDEIE